MKLESIVLLTGKVIGIDPNDRPISARRLVARSIANWLTTSASISPCLPSWQTARGDWAMLTCAMSTPIAFPKLPAPRSPTPRIWRSSSNACFSTLGLRLPTIGSLGSYAMKEF